MYKLLYRETHIQDRKAYVIRPITSWMTPLALVLLLIGVLTNKQIIVWSSVVLVLLSFLFKLFAASKTRELLSIQKQNRLTATGSRYSFWDPLTFIVNPEPLEVEEDQKQK